MPFKMFKPRLKRQRTARLTALVTLSLLDLERQVESTDGEVYSLGVHSSHLTDKRGSQITFQRAPPPQEHTEDCAGEYQNADVPETSLGMKEGV